MTLKNRSKNGQKQAKIDDLVRSKNGHFSSIFLDFLDFMDFLDFHGFQVIFRSFLEVDFEVILAVSEISPSNHVF